MYRHFIVVLVCANLGLGSARAQQIQLRAIVGGGQAGEISSLALSPDGKLLAAASTSKSLRVYSVPDGGPLGVFTDDEAAIVKVAFSPNGTTLASLSMNGSVKIWDVNRRPLGAIRTWKLFGDEAQLHIPHTTSLAFSTDGKLLATVISGGVNLFDVVSGKEVKFKSTIQWPSAVISDGPLLFSPNGRQMAIGTVLFDLAGDKNPTQLQRYRDTVTSVGFRADSKVIVSRTSGTTITMWDVGANKAISTLEGKFESSTTTIWNGTTIGWQSPDFSVQLFDIANGKRLATLACDQPCTHRELSRDGRALVTASGDTITIWEVSSGRSTAKLGPARFIAISPDRSTLALQMGRTRMGLWDVHTGKNIATLAEHKGDSCTAAFSPDGEVLATWPISARPRMAGGGNADTDIRLWDTRSGKAIANLSGNSQPIMGLTFSPDSQILVAGYEDGAVMLYRLSDGVQFRLRQGRKRPESEGLFGFGNLGISFFHVRFSLDSRFTLILAGGEIFEWNTTTDEETAVTAEQIDSDDFRAKYSILKDGFRNKDNGNFFHWPQVQYVTASRDQKYVVHREPSQLELREAATNRVIVVLAPVFSHFTRLLFSEDCKTLVGATYSHTVKVYDVATGKSTCVLQGQGAVESAILSGDGKSLVVTAAGKTTVWDLVQQKAVENTIPTSSAKFNRDCTLAAWLMEDGKSIQVWDVKRGANVATLLPGRLCFSRSRRMGGPWRLKAMTRTTVYAKDV